MRSHLIFSLFLFIAGIGIAQELNCKVSIITDAKLEVTSREQDAFKLLEQTIYDFMNNTKWTKDKFEVEERINCNVQLQINEIPQTNVYSGSLQIQSSRPVFNSSYNTTILNFQDDDITFAYSPNSVLIYAPNQFRDNITSVLAFYAYMIIGMDYDSFSPKGGTKYFNEAQQIVSNAQSSGYQGWKSNEKNRSNRYWLVDNILHELFIPLRDCNYEYHRKGLDVLYDDKVAGRAAVYDALSKLLKVVSTRPNSINVLNFVQAKSNELKNLFSDAEVKEKNDVVNLLKRIDPANSSKYQQILE